MCVHYIITTCNHETKGINKTEKSFIFTLYCIFKSSSFSPTPCPNFPFSSYHFSNWRKKTTFLSWIFCVIVLRLFLFVLFFYPFFVRFPCSSETHQRAGKAFLRAHLYPHSRDTENPFRIKDQTGKCELAMNCCYSKLRIAAQRIRSSELRWWKYKRLQPQTLFHLRGSERREEREPQNAEPTRERERDRKNWKRIVKVAGNFRSIYYLFVKIIFEKFSYLWLWLSLCSGKICVLFWIFNERRWHCFNIWETFVILLKCPIFFIPWY